MLVILLNNEASLANSNGCVRRVCGRRHIRLHAEQRVQHTRAPGDRQERRWRRPILTSEQR